MAVDIYSFSGSLDPERLRTRLRRIESSVPFIRGGSKVYGDSNYGLLRSDLLDSNNRLVLSNGSVGKLGSVPPIGVSGSFSWVSTDSGGTLYWDGTNTSQRLVIKRADNSLFTVPSGNKTITGLSANTTYTLYPFWPTNGSCAIGFVIGNAGDPKICFTAPSADAGASQNLQDREALGVLTVTTGVSGSGIPTAPTSPITCVMVGTDIEPLGDAGVRYEHLAQTEWVQIVVNCGWQLTATPNHIIYSDRKGQTQMRALEIGEYVITKIGVQSVVAKHEFERSCMKEAVHMERGHLFWANGILSHNIKLPV